MIDLGLSNDSNLYKTNEKTKQVLYCFTVKSKKYALTLVNTIANANFVSNNNFVIFACDQDSKDILDRYHLNYRETFGLNVYNDKVLNAMKLSSENKDTVIVALDTMVAFDFHDLRGRLRRFKHYRNNTIYYYNFRDSDFGYGKQDDNNVAAYCLLHYNVKQDMIEKYLKCYNTTKCFIKYGQNRSRYSLETNVTEEEVLSKHKYILRLKHFTKDLKRRMNLSFKYCNGGTTLNYMIEHNRQYHSFYYLDKDILKELINDT